MILPSLVPRLSRGRGKESLVSTVCACTKNSKLLLIIYRACANSGYPGSLFPSPREPGESVGVTCTSSLSLSQAWLWMAPQTSNLHFHAAGELFQPAICTEIQPCGFSVLFTHTKKNDDYVINFLSVLNGPLCGLMTAYW